MLSSLPPGDVPERAEEVNYVMIVADGMGGHAAGELASRMAITTLVSFALELPDWILKLDSSSSDALERARARGRAAGRRGALQEGTGKLGAERDGIDPDGRPEPRPGSPDRPRRRFARVPVPRGRPSPPHEGSHLRADARRLRAARRLRRRQLRRAAHPHERARRFHGTRRCRRRSVPPRGRRSRAALQRRADRSRRRRHDRAHAGGSGHVRTTRVRSSCSSPSIAVDATTSR